MNLRNPIRSILTSTAMAMAAVAIGTAPATAQPITINNAGFEDASVNAGNGNFGTVADWTEENAGQVFVDNNGLTWTPETDRTLYLNATNAAVNQDLTYNWSSTDTFTLGITAIEPQWKINGAGDAFSVQLRETDGTVLWDSLSQNVDGTVSGTPGNVSYTGTGHLFEWIIDASTFGPIPGAVEDSPLNIRIAQAGGNPYLDDVSLSVSSAAAVPEPTSIAIWSLIGLGLAGFGYYRTRRRK